MPIAGCRPSATPVPCSLAAGAAEVLGDYSAGPSHVLPTFGTARYASPLGVVDFQTRTSIIGGAAGAGGAGRRTNRPTRARM